MVCFYHSDRQAVGVCQHCGRALCESDAALQDDVLACKGRYQRAVEARNLMERRAAVQAGRARAAYMRNAVFYALVASTFIGLGLYQLRWLGIQAVFFIVVGLLLVYAAAANYLEGRRFGQ